MDRRSELRTISVDNVPKFSENQKFHLHLVQKTSEPSDRPIIHSTKWERLSFYRTLTATASKTEIILLGHVDLNAFIWFYILNSFLKTLPHSFVHYFMATYAPEEHLFLCRMVPLCYGFKYLLVMAALFEMLLNIDTVILLMHYVIDGLVRKNPWNRCKNATYFDEELGVIMNCLSLHDFAEKALNTTMYFDKFAYVTEDKEYFQMSQIEYYRLSGFQRTRFLYIRDLVYFAILWVIISFLYTQVEKRLFWKILNGCQWVLNTIDLLTFGYILVNDNSDPESNRQIKLTGTHPGFFSAKFWAADVDMVAESISAPAVVHILSARSTQQINPSTDSAEMVISNSLIFLFRVLLSMYLKLYVEGIVHTEIHLSDFYQRALFFFWPMYYSDFYLGNIFSIIFLALNTVLEFMAVMVTYYCLVQTIKYEWLKLKMWMIRAMLFVGGAVIVTFTSIWDRAILYIYSKSIATLTESVFLYIFYPLGRLVDDYTFHYGAPPTRLRILSLRLVPVYYTFKFYFMFQAIFDVLSKSEFKQKVPHFVWSWSLMLVPLFLGILFIMYIYLVRYRMTWQYMLRPMPKWGPRDFSERQLRKQYSSRYYISSEVPKLLSRYLIAKRESEVYKVDVRYDIQRRSTVSKAVGFGAFLNVNKKKI